MKRRDRLGEALKWVAKAIEEAERLTPKPDMLLGDLKEAQLAVEKAVEKR